MNQDRKLAIAERQREAVALRRAGLEYDAIAKRLGYASKAGAFAAVRSALRRHESEEVRELRTLTALQLDDMHAALWPRAIAGDLRAVDGVLAIMERRARLFGLDAPTKNDLRIAGAGVAYVVVRDGEEP